MLIYLGADHRGFKLKESLKNFLRDQGRKFVDCGNVQYEENDDYPDFASAVAEKVSAEPENSRGILVCGSGVGMDITANKFPRVRSAVAISADQIFDARHDDDVNVLSMASSFISQADAEKIVEVFLSTPFAIEERFQRRINKISEVENRLP